jgi:hypothetical protein
MAVGVVCVVAGLIALRGRSATVELRERGLVRLGQVLDWRKVEGFSWSPHAEATLMLRVSRRLPIFREYPLRVPPGSRDEVVQVLRDRLGQAEPASDDRHPGVEAHA